MPETLRLEPGIPKYMQISQWLMEMIQKGRFTPKDKLPSELFLLRGEEHALAHDIGVRVEETVDRLEAEVRHPDEVRVRKREGHAQAIGMRLTYEADLAGEGELCGIVLLPGRHQQDRGPSS